MTAALELTGNVADVAAELQAIVEALDVTGPHHRALHHYARLTGR
jgi:hypothetical protein